MTLLPFLVAWTFLAPPPVFYATAVVHARPLDEATGAVSVIERPEIAASQARSAADLLTWTPGLDVVSSGTRGGFSTGALRGGDPNFTFILLDGVPLNDVTDRQGGAVDLESLPASLIERVEIVRGPLSAFYGSSGLAGVVQFFTRRGDVSRRAAPTAEFEAGDASLRRALATVGGRLGARQRGEKRPGEYFVGLSWEEERRRIADERFEQADLQWSLGSALGDGLLRVAGRAALWEADDYPDASGGPRLGDGALRRSEHADWSLGATWSDARSSFSLGIAEQNLERRSPAIGVQVPASIEDTRYRRERLGMARTFLARDVWRIDAGLDGERERGVNSSALEIFPGFAVAGDFSIERTQGGAFASAGRARGNIRIDLGLRVDLLEGRGPEFNPRFGMSWRPGGGHTRLRMSLGRAFKLPGFFALASPAALGGNPELLPETSTAFDLGVERDIEFPRGVLHGSLTLFSARYENLVDFDFERFTHINRPGVDAHGVEFALGWSAGSWRVQLAATAQKVEDRTTGEPLLERPEWTAHLRMGRLPSASPLALWVDVRAVGRRPDRQIPAPERGFTAGHAIVGAALSRRLTPTIDLRGRIDNLFDEDFEVRVGFPGTPRAIRLGLRWRPAARSL